MKNVIDMLKNWQNRGKNKPIQRRGKTFLVIVIVSLILFFSTFIFLKSMNNYDDLILGVKPITNEILSDRALIEELRETDIVQLSNDKIGEDLFYHSYDAKTKEIWIEDIDYKTVLKMRLTSPYNVAGLIASEDTKVAEFLLIDWKDGKKDLIDVVKSFDAKNDYKEIDRDVWFKYGIEKQNCPENDICNNYTQWIRFNSLNELPNKNIEISMWASTKPRESIEWVPTIKGFEVLQWATYNISEMVEVHELSIAPQEGSPYSVGMSPDGSNFYIGGGTKYIHQYSSCSQAYNVSTCSYEKEELMTAMTISSRINAITFNPDGSKVFPSDNTGFLGEFTLSTPYDITTSTFQQEIDMSVTDTGTSTFSPDGLHTYTIEEGVGKVVQWDCTTAWNISTCSDATKDYTTEGFGRGIYMLANRWWKASQNAPIGIFEYAMGTDYDISTSSNTGVNTSIASDESALQSIIFGGGAGNVLNGTYLYAVGTTNDSIHQYYMSPPLDTTPPSVIINSPANTTYNIPINFTATATDGSGISDCWVTINASVNNITLENLAGDVYNYSAPTVYSEGGYLAEFFCNDTIGNVNDTETISFTVDTTNPNINITYPINSSTFSFNTVDVNYTYSDVNIDNCWYSNDTYLKNTSLTNCGTNITDVIWADGLHNVTVWANDSAGNENSSLVTFTVDAAGPTINIIFPINNSNHSNLGLDINYTAVDVIGIGSCWWSNDTYLKNTSLTNCGTNITDVIWADGLHNVTVWANDTNGLESFSTVTFLIDVTAPVGVLDSPANNTITSTTSQNFTVNITDDFGIKNATLYIYNSSDDLYNQTTQNFSEGIIETALGLLVTLADDVYTWFYEIFDFAGNEDTTENWTITIDTTNPNINITYPINNSNYTSRNLNIEYITEDTNVGNCWWSNDTMLINHSLASCGTNVTTQFWNTGNHNVTIWTNDTAGNENSSDVTFYIRNIFENSQTYSASALEQSSQTFSINITYDSNTFLNTILILHYNNTEYYGTKVGSYGDEVIYNATLTVPSLSTRTNFTFYWEISLVDGVTEFLNSTFYNQTVNNMLLGDCNAQNIGLYNFTIVDERTQVLLNPAVYNTNILVDFQLYTPGRINLVANYSQNFTKTNPISICLNNSLAGGESYILDGAIRYSADNYSMEYYHFQSATIDSTTLAQNITLFDLDNSTSTTFKIIYKDSNFIPLANALIQIQRKYINEGVFKTVEIPKTDSIGQTIAHLEEENVVYTFIVLKDGEIVATFTDFLVKCDDPVLGTCEININAFKSHLEPETFINVDDFSFTLDFNETTKTVEIIYTIPSGSSATILLNTTLSDGLGTTQVCSDSLTSASGTLSCTIPTSFGNSTVVNTIYKNGDQVARGFSSVQESPSNLYGTNLMFLGFFLIITMIGVGLGSSPMISGVFLIIGAILSIAFNLVANTGFFGYGATILWLIIAIIIVLMKGARRE